MKKKHIFIENIEYKECSTCKKIKKLECFSNNKSSWDGLKPYCKECASIKGKKYRDSYREDDLRRKKEWYKKSKINLEIRTEKELVKQNKICSKCNLELKINEFRERPNGGFYSVCRKCENEYNKRYRKENPETYKNIHAITEQRRRERAKTCISNFKNSDWKLCKDFFENSCAYCSRKMKNLTQDHFIPLSKGGNYTKGNIIPCCRSCNSSKGNKDFFAWYKEQIFYSERNENKILDYLSKYANTEVNK